MSQRTGRSVEIIAVRSCFWFQRYELLTLGTDLLAYYGQVFTAGVDWLLERGNHDSTSWS